MKIIIGLGNPGKQYEHTRHNVGFMILDELREHWDFPEFTTAKKFEAETSEGIISGEKVFLIKPQTFMNLSGVSVRKILDFYKLTPSDIFVIQDELDLPLGKHKIATNSSAAGHNGIKNIIEHLNTQTFTRLRIGITTEKQDVSCLPARNASHNDAGGRNAHDFVLERFTPEERASLHEIIPQYKEIIEKNITVR